MRLAVIGHAEHVTIARVPNLPAPGDIAHLDHPIIIAGGGGAIAFHQLEKSDAEVHFFTAIGVDDASLYVYNEIASTRGTIHAALRMESHTRDIVLVTPDAERRCARASLVWPSRPARTTAPSRNRENRTRLRCRRSSFPGFG